MRCLEFYYTPGAPFLEGLEKFSHPKSHDSNISNLIFTELFYSHILNMNRGSLHTGKKFQASKLLRFRYRWIKNGLTGPKSFRGYRETGPTTPDMFVIYYL